MVDDPRSNDTNDRLAALSGDSVTPDYAAVLDAVSDWTWRTDEAGCITALSADIARVTGRPAALYRGYRFADWGVFVRPTLPDLADSPDFRWRQPFSGPVFAVRGRTGGRRCFTLSGTPVFAPHDGRFVGYCGNARETADPEAAADRPAKIPAETPAKAPAGSPRDAPRHPADPLRRLTRLSHDIRDPLNAVLGFVQLIAATLPDSDETRAAGAYCDNAFAAAGEMLDRLEEALDPAAWQHNNGRPSPPLRPPDPAAGRDV
ncbi:MAG: hypothetical protein GVY13_01930 [Alphaproteobacteria bacterium]|jgi:PAS domain-containing protein|nr:hypothetical protein [Alphaproteobacteria bacterium]